MPIRIGAQAHLERFYGEFGFVRASDLYDEDGIPHIGLARSSFNVLALLRYGWPNGLQLSEMGELLITSRANITGLIDHLEEKGYVTRIVDEHDRRARLAKITDRGERLVNEVLPLHQRLTAELYGHLTLEEMQKLNETLKKIRQSPMLSGDDSQQRADRPVKADCVAPCTE